MSENPLINIGELSKPATVLIEKISDAVGGIFEPYQIKRVAKAEAEAKVIEAKAEIEVTELQRRAFRRFLKEEERKQRNIEEITKKALPQLSEAAQPDKVEEDWIANFFDKSHLISDDEMQTLWSRVLAGEANSPGTYSKRTINFLSSLDKSDADLFTRLCGFGWKLYEEEIIPLIYNLEEEIYSDNGMKFEVLTHLESIGLITFSSIGGLSQTELPEKINANYFGKTVELFLPQNEKTLAIGKVLLTKVGQELAPISGGLQIKGFFEYMCEKWASHGFIKKEELPEDNQPTVKIE
ncbi:MAG: DUF2806 domain-containing protein [Anaerolineales bacterium]|nr:DUF2806 domain-containing protein [Anaerolineales bacterium]